MDSINIRFFEAYKKLNTLCADMYNDPAGATSYITDMENSSCSYRYFNYHIPGWENDLVTLKRLRRIRNRLAHDTGAFDEDLCAEADILWLDEFCSRIISAKDPLALLHRLEKEREEELIRKQKELRRDQMQKGSSDHPSSSLPATGKSVAGSGGREKQGCYIATCVYGSYDAPQVLTLRRYRDEKLAACPLGKLIIRMYYTVSPGLVRLFGGNVVIRKIWRRSLDRIVGRLSGMN